MALQDQPLDVHSWLVVITFMVVIALVIKPIRIPLPIPALKHSQSNIQKEQNTSNLNNNNIEKKTSRISKYPYYFVLNIATAPVLGVLFLLATQSIKGESIKNGIVGAPDSGVEPYAVMILFFSLAYICISLDMTGVLQYAAFWISKRGGGGGQRIFLYFFLLSSIMSGLASNDVVILTMTPFLVYFSHAVSLESSVAFLMAEVQSANIASMALYIGNLTNVVACQAFKISFLEYSAWMLIPTFAAITACYIMLRVNFRREKYIPTLLKSPDIDPRSCLADPVGAVFGLCILACSLACLIGTSFAHVSVWIVTGPFALLALIRDIWFDWNGKFKGVQSVSLIVPPQDTNIGDVKDHSTSYALTSIENRIEQGLPEIAIPDVSIVQPIHILGTSNMDSEYIDSTQASTTSSSSSINGNDSNTDIKSAYSLSEMETTNHITAQSPPEQIPMERTETLTVNITNKNAVSTSEDQKPRGLKKQKAKFERRFPLLHSIFIRMPWSILPFTFSMFILVEGLSHSGWIAIFANWATKVIPNYIAGTYAIGFISVLLCNIFNNVPMTILMVRILQHPNFITSPLATPEVQRGVLFALVVGSNLGACTTLISSLAGLMWDSVLRSKNSSVGFWQFLRWNVGVMPVVIFVALSVVIAELKVIYK